MIFIYVVDSIDLLHSYTHGKVNIHKKKIILIIIHYFMDRISPSRKLDFTFCVM